VPGLAEGLAAQKPAHFYFTLWDWDGTLERIHHQLHVAVREQEGREPNPNGGDHRQPECQGRSKRGSTLHPQGLDAGKKVTGRKRPILVDTLGLLLSVAVHPFERTPEPSPFHPPRNDPPYAQTLDQGKSLPHESFLFGSALNSGSKLNGLRYPRPIESRQTNY
jgi:hypothetical protein